MASGLENNQSIFVKYRQYIIFLVAISVLVAGFSVSLNNVYNQLDYKITSFIEAEKAANQKQHEEDLDITSKIDKLNNMSDVTDEIIEIHKKLISQENELASLKNMIDFQLNTTVKDLDDTVKKVQADVKQQVQEVNKNVSSQNSLMAYQFAGTFAILGSLISFWHMMNHIRKLNEPMIQRKIVAILWMVPIYSISSWLGLVFVDLQIYLSLIKDLYEAYIIYTFLSFLIAVLARGNRNAVIDLLAQHADHMKPPIHFRFWAKRQTFSTPRHKAEAVLDQCQILCMQFVLLRPITSVIMIVCDAIHESTWDYRYPQFYIMWIVNISIFFAFTGLIRFYHVVKNDLNWINPFAKFLCIKGIVFLTFWQGILISFIANTVYNQTEVEGFNALEWSKQAQSFLICLEMFLFAIGHCFVFPTDEWEGGYRERERRRIKAKFGDNLALRDFVKDVKLVMRKKNSKKSPSKKSENADGSSNALMRSMSIEETDHEDEEQDIDWRQGWSRIEHYIDIVEAEDKGKEINDLKLDVEMTEQGSLDEIQKRSQHGIL
mmetsp:Transcript_14729/g.22319  ORF Transcript_14729/g.22319 Transcript_14729/m.22319 type:complete len:547 (+) Transcript_14729:140-1780(+)